MKIYLAGSETPAVQLEWKPQSRTNIFISFYQKSADKAIKKVCHVKRQGLLTIDSGAHSFFSHYSMSATNKKIKGTAPNPKAYFENYLEWLCHIKGKFDYFVELDIQEIVGSSQVKHWRKEFDAVGLGDKFIPVQHNCDSWKNFEQLVAETPSRYVGIEGLRKGRPPLPYMKFIKFAFDHHCRIHGFAMIKKRYLNTLLFYSVDSSSWTSWYRYGTFQVFDNKTGGLRHFNIKDALLRKNILIPGFADSRCPRKGKVADHWFFEVENAFLRLERYVSDLWKMRGIDWEKN